ncbi:hypothetical protein D3C73_1612800 [compost metagenome]
MCSYSYSVVSGAPLPAPVRIVQIGLLPGGFVLFELVCSGKDKGKGRENNHAAGLKKCASVKYDKERM